MSIFKVEVVKINSINPHPNADRLDIASIEDMGYQVIIVKGNLHPGDLAFYFPIDSVIPENFLDKFGIRNYYSKKLRAAKLRGIFSEGQLFSQLQRFCGFLRGICFAKSTCALYRCLHLGSGVSVQ
ncbi:hypothetical protein [uncultured Nostoc sp.]|uniref:hypothetical protein n=1 Tax=uncultured Nostoc sp. TaxID=340711 RepID=UPI0035CA821A